MNLDKEVPHSASSLTKMCGLWKSSPIVGLISGYFRVKYRIIGTPSSESFEQRSSRPYFFNRCTGVRMFYVFWVAYVWSHLNQNSATTEQRWELQMIQSLFVRSVCVSVCVCVCVWSMIDTCHLSWWLRATDGQGLPVSFRTVYAWQRQLCSFQMLFSPWTHVHLMWKTACLDNPCCLSTKFSCFWHCLRFVHAACYKLQYVTLCHNGHPLLQVLEVWLLDRAALSKCILVSLNCLNFTHLSSCLFVVMFFCFGIYWGFQHGGSPIYGWFTMENPWKSHLEMDDDWGYLGTSMTQETPGTGTRPTGSEGCWLARHQDGHRRWQGCSEFSELWKPWPFMAEGGWSLWWSNTFFCLYRV